MCRSFGRHSVTELRRTTMLRKVVLLTAFLLPVFASAPVAQADICFQYGTGGGIAIAIGAKVPPVNTCTPVSLVEQIYGGRLGLATGSICNSEQGSSRPTLVFQYTYDACSGPGGYFESATCRIDLEVPSGNLPNQPSNQNSWCNGVYVSLPSNQSGPLTQFNDSTLKAWNCTGGPFVVPGGGSAQCFARRLRDRTVESPATKSDETPTQRR
jgi:hypothetical protein